VRCVVWHTIQSGSVLQLYTQHQNTHIHSFIYTHTHSLIHIHTHTFTHSHTHTHIHREYEILLQKHGNLQEERDALGEKLKATIYETQQKVCVYVCVCVYECVCVCVVWEHVCGAGKAWFCVSSALCVLNCAI
jgi:hypothetical protein